MHRNKSVQKKLVRSIIRSAALSREAEEIASLVDEKAAEFQNAQSTPEESSSVSQDRHRNRLRGRVKRRARRAFWKVRSHIASRNGILPRRRPSRTGCRRSANKSGASIVGQSLQKEHQTEQLANEHSHDSLNETEGDSDWTSDVSSSFAYVSRRHMVQSRHGNVTAKSDERASADIMDKVQSFTLRVYVEALRNVDAAEGELVLRIFLDGNCRWKLSRNAPFWRRLFSHTFQKSLRCLSRMPLEFKVYRYRRLMRDAPIGSFICTLGLVYDSPGHCFSNKWLPLCSSDDSARTVRGSLKVSLGVYKTADLDQKRIELHAQSGSDCIPSQGIKERGSNDVQPDMSPRYVSIVVDVHEICHLTSDVLKVYEKADSKAATVVAIQLQVTFASASTPITTNEAGNGEPVIFSDIQSLEVTHILKQHKIIDNWSKSESKSKSSLELLNVRFFGESIT
uniref:FerIin domain-containing protein n=1 Tax=Ascaris lumbricoides TaxID=6252 RepID=A0A9J2PNB1_ASCLU